MITISFYSYKGGVGRSLTLANLAVYLAQFGATVAMVDFDLEAPGLHYKIRPDKPIEIHTRGIAGLLADISSGAAVAEFDPDFAIDLSEHAEAPGLESHALEQPRGRLLLIPAGNPLESGYWRDLAAIDWDRLFTSPDRPGIGALAQLKQSLIDQYAPDVLLVDSRTGITPGGGVATTLLPDVVVTMLLNTAEHLDGSRLVVSAVTSSGAAEREPPMVIPVLSRYTSSKLADRGDAQPKPPTRLRAGSVRLTMPDANESAPLTELRSALVRELSPAHASHVAEPLVLHADLALQHHEVLAFGPYASMDANTTGQALLEDYLRLFAALVPREMFLRYLTGVRNRVRSILLDSPDDAVHTLESLATLVGDEAAFIDLMKVYVLRRDTRNMLLAADRLYGVHGRIIAQPALSRELRTLAVGNRPGVNRPSISADFAERYWHKVAPNDIAWGAGVVRLLADSGLPDRARRLADEIIASHADAESLATIISVIARGSDKAELLAVELAIDSFDVGATSNDFLQAATEACKYQESSELARRILDAPAGQTIPDEARINLMQIAGRFDDAATLLLEALTSMESIDVSGDYVDMWSKLVRRVPRIRDELLARNPSLLDYFETIDEEELRGGR